MPSWSSREELVHQAVLLTRQGMGVRSVARSLGVARKTVRKLLAGHEAALTRPHSALPEKPLRAPRDTKVTPWAERIAALLGKYEDITAQRVFETIAEEGYAGGYTAIKDHVREVRPRPAVTPSLPTPTHGPGEMAESDWTPCTVPLTGGGRLTVQIHGFVLCHSRRKVFRVHERCDLHALMRCCAGSIRRRRAPTIAMPGSRSRAGFGPKALGSARSPGGWATAGTPSAPGYEGRSGPSRSGPHRPRRRRGGTRRPSRRPRPAGRVRTRCGASGSG